MSDTISGSFNDGMETDDDHGEDEPDNMVCENSENGLDAVDMNDAYRVNPLLVDIVFQRVLEYVDLQSLYSCRLVCEEWCTEAWDHLMERKLFSFTKTNASKLIQSLSKLSNTRLSSPTKLEFRGFSVADHRSELETLFRLIGPNVIELTLKFQDNELHLEELEHLFLQSFPNLEYLALESLPCSLFPVKDAVAVGDLVAENPPYKSILTSGDIPPLLKLKTIKLGSRCHYIEETLNEDFFLELLHLTPNLEKLEGLVEWCAPKLVKALDILQLPKLVHLVLRGAFNEETARTLEKFHLQSFYLGVSGHYNDDYRHNVIYQQRSTLQTLGLGWSSFKSRIHIEDLKNTFPFLTYLSLCDSSKWVSDSCPKKYSIGEGIKKLRADIRMPNDFTYLDAHANAFQNVKELDISFLNRSLQKDLKSMIIETRNLFPVLTVLTLHLGYKFPLHLIFELFTGLTELNLLFDNGSSRKENVDSGYLDSQLIGVEESECSKFREENKPKIQSHCMISSPSSREYNLVHSESFFQDATFNLSNLSELRKLVIMGDTACVSHVTAIVCLLNMKKLTSITIKPATENMYPFLKSTLSPAVFLDITERPSKSTI